MNLPKNNPTNPANDKTETKVFVGIGILFLLLLFFSIYAEESKMSVKATLDISKSEKLIHTSYENGKVKYLILNCKNNVCYYKYAELK